MKSVPLSPTVQSFAVPSPVGHWSISTANDQLVSIEYLDALPTEGLRTEPETKLEMRLDCMLSRYFKGEPIDFTRVPIAFPQNSSFLCSVMQVLLQIPYGETRHYGWIAEQLGKPGASRAVGGALGRNPIPIIVPCHRIITKDGLLGGFMRDHPSGSRLKTFLLDLEGIRPKPNKLALDL